MFSKKLQTFIKSCISLICNFEFSDSPTNSDNDLISLFVFPIANLIPSSLLAKIFKKSTKTELLSFVSKKVISIEK